MIQQKIKSYLFILALAVLTTGAISVGVPTSFAQSLKPLEITDIMKFREIKGQAWSKTGQVYAYSAVPDRGDATGYVVILDDGNNIKKQFEVIRGVKPKVTKDGRYVFFTQVPTLLEQEKATFEKQTPPMNQGVLLNTQTGEQKTFEQVTFAGFTGTGSALVLLTKNNQEKHALTDLEIYDLDTQKNKRFNAVKNVHLASKTGRIAFTHYPAVEEGQTQVGQIWVYNSENKSHLVLLDNMGEASATLSFNKAGDRLAILAAESNAAKNNATRNLWLWQVGSKVEALNWQAQDWQLTEHSKLKWHFNDAALQVGAQTVVTTEPVSDKSPEVDDLYNIERLLKGRTLQVWHGEDERIITQQRVLQKRLAAATAEFFYWFESDEWIQATLNTEAQLSIPHKKQPQALITDGSPYLRETTWAGFYHDLYTVNLKTGEQQKVATQLPAWSRGSLSPNGRYVAYVEDEKLYAFDLQNKQTKQVASQVSTSWVNELEDRPTAPSAYGISGWLSDSSAFYVYDRHDIWLVTPLDTARNVTLGQGRAHDWVYRILAKSQGSYQPGEPLLIRQYHEADKTSGFAHLNPTTGELTALRVGEKNYQLVKRFDKANRYFFTEQDFRQFPDVQVAQKKFSAPVRLTDVNPQQANFKWGHAELVAWESQTGEPLQGVLLKPDGYDKNKKYPMIVYYYEKFSQRLYDYNQMKVNHRPNFPFYLGQDYLVFLPDIHFREGAPGSSATESLVPAMEMLIEQGVVDAKAIGLHGHSWSGYQTAFVVTETDMFAAAVSGAPVSNMTSAYSGIRWESGLARQFQYETGQSRIGPSLFENRELYIKNSPVFYADKINTPMVIQFGDKDGAVPWEQGIEYYLALRRLNKPVVMLHYEGEPHHLQVYANKVDYSLKMLEFFDHYLKGKKAPTWWEKGLAFQVYPKGQ